MSLAEIWDSRAILQNEPNLRPGDRKGVEGESPRNERVANYTDPLSCSKNPNRS